VDPSGNSNCISGNSRVAFEANTASDRDTVASDLGAAFECDAPRNCYHVSRSLPAHTNRAGDAHHITRLLASLHHDGSTYLYPVGRSLSRSQG